MNLSLIALSIFAIAVMTTGLIEHTKGWWKKYPQWFPSVASPVLNLVLGQLVAPLAIVAGARLVVVPVARLGFSERDGELRGGRH